MPEDRVFTLFLFSAGGVASSASSSDSVPPSELPVAAVDSSSSSGSGDDSLFFFFSLFLAEDGSELVTLVSDSTLFFSFAVVVVTGMAIGGTSGAGTSILAACATASGSFAPNSGPLIPPIASVPVVAPSGLEVALDLIRLLEIQIVTSASLPMSYPSSSKS